MKKTLLLVTVALLVTSTVGCGCCRRLRDRLCRGAFCGATPLGAPAVMGVAPTPVYAPQAVAPMATAPLVAAPQAVVPCEPCCVPCDPCCAPDPCCTSYGYGGCEGPMMDSGYATSEGCCDGASLGAPVESYQGGVIEMPADDAPSIAPPRGGNTDPGPATN